MSEMRRSGMESIIISRSPDRLALSHKFWANVSIREPSVCWFWKGATNGLGYGRFWIGRIGCGAHRLAYALTRGKIPNGLTLDHLCRKRLCVNPQHLQPTPNRTNILRGQGITAEAAAKKLCPQSHAYDAIDSNGARICQRCRAQANARHKARRKLNLVVPLSTATCDHCNQKYQMKVQWQRYCDEHCRWKAVAAKRQVRMRAAARCSTI